MQKKILFAIPQLTGGGAERVVSVWANELSARGYEVSILLFRRAENEYYTNENVRIIALASCTEEYKKMSYLRRYKFMRRTIRNLRPDSIVSFLPSMQVWMMFASMGMKIRRIETIRTNPWRMNFPNIVLKTVWHRCFHSADGIIVQAKDQIPYFSQRDQRKCTLIPNPISPLYVENFKADIADEVRSFIVVGRLAIKKRYDMIIRAFTPHAKKHPELTLKIYGTGNEDYVESLRRMIADAGMENNIFLMGRHPHMEEEYKKADAFILGSDFEGMPNVLMEAMASRLVCISTDCKTGPADLIDDGTSGYLIPVGDEKALEEKIGHILEMSKTERSAMADAAREKILRFCSQKNSVEKLVSLLEQL